MNIVVGLKTMVPIRRKDGTPPKPRYDYSAGGGSGSNLDTELKMIYDSMVDLRE